LRQGKTGTLRQFRFAAAKRVSARFDVFKERRWQGDLFGAQSNNFTQAVFGANGFRIFPYADDLLMRIDRPITAGSARNGIGG
jgi:hypothetical protein